MLPALYIHPSVNTEGLIYQLLNGFCGAAVLACRESLAVFNRVGVLLIVHKPISNIAGCNSFPFSDSTNNGQFVTFYQGVNVCFYCRCLGDEADILG